MKCFEYGTLGRIHNTSFSTELTNVFNKLVSHWSSLEMLARDKNTILWGPFVSDKENEVVEYNTRSVFTILHFPCNL